MSSVRPGTIVATDQERVSADTSGGCRLSGMEGRATGLTTVAYVGRAVIRLLYDF